MNVYSILYERVPDCRKKADLIGVALMVDPNVLCHVSLSSSFNSTYSLLLLINVPNFI